MTDLAIKKELALTKEEKEQFEFHSLEIKKGFEVGRAAKNIIISHVLSILENELWRENYKSEEEYVKTELNLEISSFRRETKNNRNYLFLISNTDDIDEQITLTRMTGYAYRELRRLATDNKPILKKGGESDEEYRDKLLKKEEEDSILILELWKEVYPRIVKFKKDSNTGIYTNGGYSITAKDIIETCLVLQQVLNIPKLLNEGVSPSEISVGTIEGEDISLEEVIESSGEYSTEVIDAVRDLGISEALSEKLKRQSNHIHDSLLKRYTFDKIEGSLFLKNGRLIIQNQFGDFDLIEEWADLLGKQTVVSARRTIREI